MTRTKSAGEKRAKSKSTRWYMSARIVAIAVGGAITFLLATAIPLYRRELLPKINPSSLVKLKLEYNGDEGRNLWVRGEDELVFAEGSAGFVLRVSNTSDFEVTLEDLRVETRIRTYSVSHSSGENWEGGWFYVSGADVLYESLYIDVCEMANDSKNSVFKVGRIGEEEDLSRFRRIVYVIPPHATDYVLVTVACNNYRDEVGGSSRKAVLLSLMAVFVLEGREFSTIVESPVHLLEYHSFWGFPSPEMSPPTLRPQDVFTHHDQEPY